MSRILPGRRWQMGLALGAVYALVACSTAGAADPYGPGTAWTGERRPSAQTLLTMAHILAKKENDPQCEVVLYKLIEIYPDFAPAYNELAELRMRAGNRAAAKVELRAGLERCPDDPVLRNNLGMCYLLEEDYAGAEEQFRAACEVAPHDARPRANLALAVGLAGRMSVAERLYLQSMGENAAYGNLIVLCQLRGDAEGEAEYRAKRAGRRPPTREATQSSAAP